MHIRTANANDADDVTRLLGRAYPLLMAPFYDAHALAAALPSMTKANPDLLASGTYYVAEAEGRIAGCGGWTFEQPGTRKVETGLAHLRHFATDPDVTRQGIGRALYRHCATIAAEHGATRFQAFAGLNAEPFYLSLGLKRLQLIDIPIGGGAKLPTVLMEGQIVAQAP